MSLSVRRRRPRRSRSALGFAIAVLAAAPAAGVLQARVSAAPQAPASPSAAPAIVDVRIDGPVTPVMADFVVGALKDAAARQAALVLITIDTPGGLSQSMQAIIQQMLDSPVPVAVYVSPAGARAASAGFFILQAADIAAMAPGTHTGAASPLLAIGGMPVEVDETLSRKIMEDATAYMRSLVAKRGRNVALAESAVTEGKAFTETEALAAPLVDLIAPSADDLLARLDGRAVTRFDGRTTTLTLAGASRRAVTMTARERFLARLVQADVFFVLLIVAALGLYTEFTYPGLIAPGVIGGIAAVLAMYAMHVLPVNFTGLLLLALALALFILEAKYASHGVLGAGGVVAMLLGAIMLIDSPLTAGGVSLSVALGAAAPFALIVIVLMRLVLRSRTWTPMMGDAQLVGARGEMLEVTGDAGGRTHGLARVHGEIWRTTAERPTPAGTEVTVVRVDGLTLHVEPARPGPPATQHP